MTALIALGSLGLAVLLAWLGAWLYCRRFPLPTIDHRVLVHKESGMWHWLCTCGHGGGLAAGADWPPGACWEMVLATARCHVRKEN